MLEDNPEALQGFHAEHLLFLIDEASGIPDVVFEVGMGALSTPGAKVLMARNPTRTSGFFYDTHHSLRGRWHTMHVSCLDVPRAQGHIEDIRSKYGDNSNAWRVRVLGEFPTADDETIIPLELVRAAIDRDVATLDYHPVWGLDVARFGDDRTALAKSLHNKLLEPVKAKQNLDTIQVVGWLKNEYLSTEEHMRPSSIMIDAIGIGAGVYDLAKLERLPVRPVNVGEAPGRNGALTMCLLATFDCALNVDPIQGSAVWTTNSRSDVRTRLLNPSRGVKNRRRRVDRRLESEPRAGKLCFQVYVREMPKAELEFIPFYLHRPGEVH